MKRLCEPPDEWFSFQKQKRVSDNKSETLLIVDPAGHDPATP